MTGEFTIYCNNYYQLSELLAKREERLKNLLDNAPHYTGQTNLSEVDTIISYYRNVQAFKKKVDKTMDDLRATERVILMIIRHFEIPPHTVLTGEIPGVLQYQIWANENDTISIKKTKDLAPEVDGDNIMTIKLWSAYREEED